MRELWWYELWSRRAVILWWGLGLTAFGWMYTLIYPEMEGQLGGLAELSIYEAMGVELAGFEGFMASTVIGFVPILLGVYAILAGTATLAGEEDDGTLELLLTTSLSRAQIVGAKAAALVVCTAVIVLLAGVGEVVGFSLVADQIETTVTGGDIFAVVVSSLPLVWALLMSGLFFGALLPSRRLAMMAGFLFLAVNYFGENMVGMIDSLEPLRPFFLFTYFDSTAAVFTDGVAPADVGVLLVTAAVFLGLALYSFQRRDVTVGNWPWQRVRMDG